MCHPLAILDIQRQLHVQNVYQAAPGLKIGVVQPASHLRSKFLNGANVLIGKASLLQLPLK